MNKRSAFSLPSVTRFLMSASVAAVMAFYATGAYAVVGCNDKVMEAMKAKAEAKVAQDVAVTESLINKPDSVLAMTCFNQAAGTLAKTGGEIFSGDFTAQLAPMVTEGLNSFYDDFAGASGFNSFADALGIDLGTLATSTLSSGLSSALGGLGVDMSTIGQALDIFGTVSTTVQGISDDPSFAGIVNYATQLTDITSNPDVKCEGIKRLWDDIKGKGINTKIPKLTMEDLRAPTFGDLPAGIQAALNAPEMATFKKNWEANITNQVFQKLDEALDELPQPATPINFTNTTSSCQVLLDLGVIAGPCN